MSALASSLRHNLVRYGRSKGLWLMLIIAPIASRLMISDEQGRGIIIAVGRQLPVLSSSVVGVWLGIVISTTVLPIAFVYLRANTTRVQPWQIIEVSGASPVAVQIGRFFADCIILMLILALLSFSGLFLAWVLVDGPWEPLAIVVPLWVIAAPTLIMVAAIKSLFDALPVTRGALGEVLFLVLWAMALAVPIARSDLPSTLPNNLLDVAGYARPLVAGAPGEGRDFAIGSMELVPGRVELDVERGLAAPGYLHSRLTWLGIALALVAIAGLIHRPHSQSQSSSSRWSSFASRRRPVPKVGGRPAAAGLSSRPYLRLLVTEARLVSGSDLTRFILFAAAISAWIIDYRSIGCALASLVLVFSITNHTGRCEAKGYTAFTQTLPHSGWTQRVCVILTGSLLLTATALPAAVASLSFDDLAIAGLLGVAISTIASVLAALTKSAFPGRLILLVLWYGYFAG